MPLGLEKSSMARECRKIYKLLKQSQLRLALAESCTGGLIAGQLAQIPGISEHFCGSAVVYRYDTKARWLGLSRRELDKKGAVTAPCAKKWL